VDDLGTIFFILFFGDPLGFESREGGKSGTTSPYGVISILGGDDLNLVLLWSKVVELFLKSIWETFIKSGSTGEDYVSAEIFSNIKIAFFDRLVTHGVHSWGFISFLNKAWVEKCLWSHESWGIDVNGLTIRELVSLLNLGG